MSESKKINIVDFNIPVLRARKLLAERNVDGIPELSIYYERYKEHQALLEEDFADTGLNRYAVLANFKAEVAAEVMRCISALNVIRLENEAYGDQSEPRNYKYNI